MATAMKAPDGADVVPPDDHAGDLILLSLPSRPEYVGLARLAVAGLARVSGLHEETVADLKLGVTEACTLALQHAPDRDGATLELSFSITPRRWVIEVASPLYGQDQTMPAVDASLGLLVMRELVDQVDLDTSGQGRMLLRLTKRL